MSALGQIAAIFELCVGIFIEFVAILLFLRYREKKGKNALFITITCVFAGAGAFCSFTARVLVNFYGFVGTENYLVAMFVQDYFALTCDALALLAFYFFAEEVFAENKSSIISALMVMYSLAIAIFMFVAPLVKDPLVGTLGYA